MKMRELGDVRSAVANLGIRDQQGAGAVKLGNDLTGLSRKINRMVSATVSPTAHQAETINRQKSEWNCVLRKYSESKV
jgi:hypothetical protein